MPSVIEAQSEAVWYKSRSDRRDRAAGGALIFADRSKAGAVSVIFPKAVAVARKPLITDLVENDSSNGMSCKPEGLERFGDARPRRTAPLNNHYDLVRDRRESERVNDRQERRG